MADSHTDECTFPTCVALNEAAGTIREGVNNFLLMTLIKSLAMPAVSNKLLHFKALVSSVKKDSQKHTILTVGTKLEN